MRKRLDIPAIAFFVISAIAAAASLTSIGMKYVPWISQLQFEAAANIMAVITPGGMGEWALNVFKEREVFHYQEYFGVAAGALAIGLVLKRLGEIRTSTIQNDLPIRKFTPADDRATPQSQQ